MGRRGGMGWRAGRDRESKEEKVRKGQNAPACREGDSREGEGGWGGVQVEERKPLLSLSIHPSQPVLSCLVFSQSKRKL